jgi:hypothetical protein
MVYTDTELETFIKQNDMDFIQVDKTSSIKTDMYILSTNFDNLKIFLSKLKALVVKSKISLSLNNTLVNNENQIVNGITYNIVRVDNLNFNITNITNPSWITDDLIIQVKNVLGVINNSVIITTINNSILITFSDIISNVNKIYMI